MARCSAGGSCSPESGSSAGTMAEDTVVTSASRFSVGAGGLSTGGGAGAGRDGWGAGAGRSG